MMAKAKRGTTLVCALCAREVVVNNWGISGKSLWCCGRPMKKKRTVRKKAAKKK